MSEIDEARVQVAAAWVQFDKLKSEVESLSMQLIISLGKILKAAENGKAMALNVRALPKDIP